MRVKRRQKVNKVRAIMVNPAKNWSMVGLLGYSSKPIMRGITKANKIQEIGIISFIHFAGD